jgi:hypothetical protein
MFHLADTATPMAGSMIDGATTMSDFCAHASDCPPLIDIIDLLVSFSRQPEAEGFGVHEIISRLGRRIEKLSGLAIQDVIEAGNRVATELPLAGTTLPVRNGYAAAYGGGRLRGLRHVAVQLRKLDRDGTTARRIFPWLCKQLPIFDKACRALESRDAVLVPGAPAQVPNSSLPAAANGADPGKSEPIAKVTPEPAHTHRMNVEQANDKAMALAKRMGKRFFRLSEREQAKRIGCHWSTWAKTEFYRQAKKKAPLQRRVKINAPRSPRTVCLTSDLEAVTPLRERPASLKRLIAEHEADSEPSPLDDDPPGARPRKVLVHKRL